MPDNAADLPRYGLADPCLKLTAYFAERQRAVGDDGREAILAVGEAKWHETMGLAHLDRLRRIRGLLTAQGRPGAAGSGS